MTFNWKAIVGAVAPTLATALGGPLAGQAVSMISQAVLGKADGTEVEISEAMASGMKPETLLALKQAEQAFELEMRKLEVEEGKVHHADRDSARAREIAIRDWIPATLALASFIGFFAVFTALFLYEAPASTRDFLMMMLGMLSVIVSSVVNYYFGSSVGSARKTAILDKHLSRVQ